MREKKEKEREKDEAKAARAPPPPSPSPSPSPSILAKPPSVPPQKKKTFADACIGGNSAEDAVVEAWMRAVAEAAEAAEKTKARGDDGDGEEEKEKAPKPKVTSCPSLAQQLMDYRRACEACKGEDALAEAWRAKAAGGGGGRCGRRGGGGGGGRRAGEHERGSARPPPPPPPPILEWSDAVDDAADAIAEGVVRDVAREAEGALGALAEEGWRAEVVATLRRKKEKKSWS